MSEGFLRVILFERRQDFSLEQGHVLDRLFMRRVPRSGSGDNVTEAPEKVVVGNESINDGLWGSGNRRTQHPGFAHTARQEAAQRIFCDVTGWNQKVGGNLESLAEEELAMLCGFLLCTLFIVR